MKDKDKHHNKEIQIDLGRVITAIFKRIKIIAAVTALSGILTFIVTGCFIPPKYESKVMFYVNNRNMVANDLQNISTGDISASRSLVSTYIVMLNTRTTLMEVVNRAGVNYTYKEIGKMVSAQAMEDTEIFQVVVTSKDSAEADRIADAIGEILPEKITGVIDGTSVKIVEESVIAAKPTSPKVARWTFLGAVLGMFATVGWIVISEIFGTTVRCIADISQVSCYPVLASVSGIDRDAGCDTTEMYNRLGTKVHFANTKKETSCVIGITSASAGEGKSVTAAGLADSMAQLNKKVLLVDCNMRMPSIASKLNLKKSPGLKEYISEEISFEKVLQLYISGKDGIAFDVISAGYKPDNPTILLSSEKMKQFIAIAKSNYEYVIMDLPAMDEVADTMIMAEVTDGMLVVVRIEHTTRDMLTETLEQLELTDTKILGIVATDTEGL